MENNNVKQKEAERVETVENTTKESTTSEIFQTGRQKKGIIGFVFRHWATILAIIYIVSPIDLIPDFIPGIGQIDDLLALVFTLYQEYKAYKGNQIEN